MSGKFNAGGEMIMHCELRPVGLRRRVMSDVWKGEFAITAFDVRGESIFFTSAPRPGRPAMEHENGLEPGDRYQIIAENGEILLDLVVPKRP